VSAHHPNRSPWGGRALGLVGLLVLGASPASAHSIYLMNDNHTDYGWNATTAVYEAAMLGEIDYYLDRIDATSGNAPAEQARFNGDNWYYLYLYEQNRSPAQFQRLIARMLDGHITFPLNPLVELYGALPTEAAIRAGYYPGRIERAHGVQFLLAQQEEDATIPWGVAQIWAGSRAKYTWRGVCECFHLAPYQNRTDEVFRWQGPDDSEVLMKWYQPPGDTGRTYGGYAEARDNLSPSALQAAIDRFSARPPFVPITGLFGAGWDDVSYQTDSVWQTVQSWNAAHPGGDRAVMSNGVDYFLDLENYRGQLNTVRGGWGSDWDAWPAKLAAEVSRCKRAFEKLRTAEALSVLAQWSSPAFWGANQPLIEAATLDLTKVFEHNWADGGVSVPYIVANKKAWTADLESKVDTVYGNAVAQVRTLFRTPDEDRIVVFNPLGFPRTDFADLPVADNGPYVVTDLEDGTEVPSQVVTVGGSPALRVLASNVPALGYRTYRYAAGTGTAFPGAASIAGNTISNGRYSVTFGTRGDVTSLVDVATDRQLAGSGLNDFGSGSAGPPTAVDVGPVSATLIADVAGMPARRVSLTLFATPIDRVTIDDEILQNYTATSYYRFNMNLVDPVLHFEEVGAIARTGLVAEGGDFQPGTRADVMTLNHFVELADEDYVITLSNSDAIDFRQGASTTSTFDLGTPEVDVLALGIVSPVSGDITTQGGDSYFHHGFAMRGRPGAFDGADAMRFSLAHQNPLVALALPRNQMTAPLTSVTRGFALVNAPNVVVTAFKPAEESERGFLVRMWELSGQPANFAADVSAFSPQAVVPTSLIETDIGTATLNADGTFPVAIDANEMKTYRFVPGAFGDCSAAAQCDDGDLCSANSCDASAGCLHVPQGVAFGGRTRLRWAKLEGSTAVTISTAVSLPYPFSPGLDPSSNGLRLRLGAGAGRTLWDLQIPGGAADPATGVGWTAHSSAGPWHYRDAQGALTAIRSALVRVSGGGGGSAATVQIQLRGRGLLPVTPGDQPLTLQILAGKVASQCGQVQYSASPTQAPACRFNSAATVLRCG
jgi:alpha-mannosidase